MPKAPWAAAVDAALIDVCRVGSPDLPTEIAAVEEFVSAARHHRIGALAHVVMRKSRPDVGALLKPDRDAALMYHLRMCALLAAVARILDDIPWAVFKGPVLSEFAHPFPGLRFYKDLDVLVAPRDFRRAYDRLFDAGWRTLVGNSSLARGELPGELPLGDATHGILLDLHWSMVVMKSRRANFSVEAEALLERRVPVAIGPARVSILDPVDALVHVCQHAALIGATRLGHVLDADQLARQVEDWTAVIDTAERWRARAQVAAVLGRAQRLFGTPVPDDLARSLRIGPGMRAALALVDDYRPIASLRRDESWVRMFTKAATPSLITTVGNILGKAGPAMRSRWGSADAVSPPTSADADVLDAFFSRVEAGAHHHSGSPSG